MPYEIDRHMHDMLWVKIHGYLAMDHAESYLQELWRTMNDCPRPTDLLVDGRHISGGSGGARQRTEQIAHHPHLGHIAFVVSAQHLLVFAPLVNLVSGIGLFGNEQDALSFLHNARGTSTVGNGNLPNLLPRSAPSQRSAPPPPPMGLFGLLESWGNSLAQSPRQGDRD